MKGLLRKSQLFIKQNASTILTVAGGVGVVATAVMAVKATPKALERIEEAKKEKGEELTKFETVVVSAKPYIPAIATGAATIACIYGANVLNKRQQAALMSAYALVDTSFKEYKSKLKELYGEDSDELIRERIAEDKYRETDIHVQDDKQLFYDDFSERFFESTMQDVLMAENKLNRQIAINTGAYLNEFYEFLDIPTIPAGKELGWSNGILESMYWTNWVDFDHSERTTDDGVTYYSIKMLQEPVIDFAYY